MKPQVLHRVPQRCHKILFSAFDRHLQKIFNILGFACAIQRRIKYLKEKERKENLKKENHHHHY